MKKLFLFCIALLVYSAAVNAQDTIGPINDTLRYFSYKRLYKLPPTTAQSKHPFYKSDYGGANSTNLLSHVGSVFKNKDAALLVYGLETRLYRPVLVDAQTNDGGVQFRLYLCNVLNGVPVFPALDSVQGGIDDNGSGLPCPTCTATPYQRIGKYFGATFANGPKSVSGDFAVLGRCVSTVAGDTVNFFHTGGYTATNTAVPAASRFGEGSGVVRKLGIFYPTTNFADPRFGPGTDYEFCFAPMVTFTLHVSQIESATLEGACQCEIFTHTNTSSPEFTNRQFNFNQFYRELRPFDPASSVATNFTADSVLAWDVGDGAPPFYLPVGIDSVHLRYSNGICNRFFDGIMSGKYKQAAYNVLAPTLTANLTFTGSCVWCNDTAFKKTSPCDIVGLGETEKLGRLKVYPNPTFDKTIISGLQGSNTIYIYNMMGQLLSSEVTSLETVLIDLTKQARGTYLVRITNAANKKKLFRIIRQ